MSRVVKRFPTTADAMEPLLVDVPTAMRLLDISRPTLYRMKDLDWVHIGRSARITLASIRAKVEKVRQRPS